MIEGLNLLPYVQARKDEIAKAGQAGADNYLECSNCLQQQTKLVRRSWHCGYLPVSEHKGPGFLGGGSDWPNYTTCPGYTISLPQVYETARARMLWDKGCLKLRHKKPSDALLSAIEILQCSASKCETLSLNRAGSDNGSR